MKKVDIFTDGACSGNPGPGGYAAILKYADSKKEVCGFEPQTTNNRMELMAVLAAIELLKQPCEVTVYSDSKYIVDAIKKGWLARWQQNGWRKSDKKQVQNIDLWGRLLPLLGIHVVDFVWVKGHANHPENERCDWLAVKAIKVHTKDDD
ncbi:MAG: ribonuclease HI [Oscillospiraceae bacterium]|jgi:ribonuclease HI|nr:ribonuclease HI [Oscillospiraceae bacterium]